MNQILFTDNNFKKRKLKKFKFVFFSSLFIIIFFMAFYIINYYTSTKKEDFSYAILNNFNIQRLYSTNNSTTIILNSDEDFFVIGSIEVPSIGIKYPILSNASDELLKIAPCRFFGPFPNEVGNLCIAAHNYDNNKFFSNLHKLEIGDPIKIYDSNNSLIIYYVYNKYEINQNNTSCTSQYTHGKREITLVTCNNINKNRLIVKAKE